MQDQMPSDILSTEKSTTAGSRTMTTRMEYATGTPFVIDGVQMFVGSVQPTTFDGNPAFIHTLVKKLQTP